MNICQFLVFCLSLKKTIANKKLHIEKLKEQFNNASSITTSEIIEFYSSIEPSLKRSTIDWRIYHLTQNKILYRLSRGRYTISDSNKPIFLPEIDRSIKKLYSSIKSQLPYINFIVWQTKWLNEFMRHQPGKFITIVEVEKDVMESVFNLLQNSQQNVFISPSQDIIHNYVYNSKFPIVIENLISEAPTQKIKNLETTTIEKILVDLISDTDLFSTFQGRELYNIYENAFSRYYINISKMKRYANRRNKTNKLEGILNETMIRH